ncbi:MAG: DUF1566 domain-containing protein, partial [Oligoflexus sp.]|nr:DUF1566 domain-containing protein [Oligoflexus sp.]
SLGLVGCDSGVDLKTVGGIQSSKQAIVKYQPGAKIIVEQKDANGEETYPVALFDPSQVCADLTFYNQVGDVVQGTRSCDGSGISPSDPNLRAENIKAGISIGSIEGNLKPSPEDCNSDGAMDCVVVGPTYAALLKTGADNKILAGNTIGSVTGNVTLPAVTKVLSSTTFGVSGTGLTGTLTLPLASNVKTGTSAYGEPGSQLTPSYSPDFPSVANVRTIDTVDGAAGTLNDCSSNGTTGCVTTATYQSADLTNLSAGNIKRGVSLAGTTGNFPSATSPLLRYSDSGATTTTAGSDITDLTSFITQLTTDGSFEYWSSSGIRMTGSGDSDLTAANVKSPVALENVSITGSYTGAASNCTADGQTGCTTTSTFKSVDTSALSVWDIRKGKSAGGIAGSIAFYKNMANTTLFDRTTGTGSAAGLDAYDTIDDYNNNGAFPTQNNTGWDQATGANWTQVVASTVYKDNITGLVWLADQASTFTWDNAITQCENSTAGSRTDWRLPTQKEWMQAYTDGIWSQKTTMSLASYYYWSASTLSDDTTKAWIVYPNYGYTLNYNKTLAFRVACVAP